jgi:hypothetical protein
MSQTFGLKTPPLPLPGLHHRYKMDIASLAC